MEDDKQAKFAWAKYYRIKNQDRNYLESLFHSAIIIKQANKKMFKIFVETIWNFVKIKELTMNDRFYVGMTKTTYNEKNQKWVHTHPITNVEMYETKKNKPHVVSESRQINRDDYVLDLDLENYHRFQVNMTKYEKIKDYYKLK